MNPSPPPQLPDSYVNRLRSTLTDKPETVTFTHLFVLVNQRINFFEEKRYERYADWKQQLNMLETAETYFENHADVPTIDISVVTDTPPNTEQYQIGRAPGSLFYTFDQTKLREYNQKMHSLGAAMDYLNERRDEIKLLINDQTLPPGRKNNLKLYLQDEELYWLRKVETHKRSEDALNAKIFTTLIKQLDQD